MRHRFEIIKDEGGTRYKCKRCGSIYSGPNPTKIPCQAIMKLDITDKVLKRSEELINAVR